jgi:hypothetical protein
LIECVVTSCNSVLLVCGVLVVLLPPG